MNERIRSAAGIVTTLWSIYVLTAPGLLFCLHLISPPRADRLLVSLLRGGPGFCLMFPVLIWILHREFPDYRGTLRRLPGLAGICVLVVGLFTYIPLSHGGTPGTLQITLHAGLLVIYYLVVARLWRRPGRSISQYLGI